MIRKRLFLAGLVVATLLLAALGTAISLVRSVRATLAPSLDLERSTAL